MYREDIVKDVFFSEDMVSFAEGFIVMRCIAIFCQLTSLFIISLNDLTSATGMFQLQLSLITWDT